MTAQEVNLYRKRVISKIYELTYKVERARKPQDVITEEKQRQISAKARNWEEQKFREFNGQISEGYENTVKAKIRAFKEAVVSLTAGQHRGSSQNPYPMARPQVHQQQYDQGRRDQMARPPQRMPNRHPEQVHLNPSYREPVQEFHGSQPRIHQSSTAGSSYTERYDHKRNYYKIMERAGQIIPKLVSVRRYIRARFQTVREEARTNPARAASLQKYKLILERIDLWQCLLEDRNPPQDGYAHGVQRLENSITALNALDGKISLQMQQQQQRERKDEKISNMLKKLRI